MITGSRATDDTTAWSRLAPRGEGALAVREITPAAVTERLARHLRELVGPGRRWSYAELAARTGIDLRTLKAYVTGAACPNLAKYKRLVVVLGPEVTTDLNRMLGWAPRAGREPPEALDLAALEDALLRAEAALGRTLGPRHGDLAPLGARTSRRPDPRAAAALDTLPAFLDPLPPGAITPHAIASRLSYRLRRMLQPGSAWSAAGLGAATGISRPVVEAYVAGTACPNLARYFRLERVLGHEIGIEFALMLGWAPRHRAGGEPPALLDDLRSRVRACLKGVEAVAAQQG